MCVCIIVHKDPRTKNYSFILFLWKRFSEDLINLSETVLIKDLFRHGLFCLGQKIKDMTQRGGDLVSNYGI